MSPQMAALGLFGVLVLILDAALVWALLYAHGEREQPAEVEAV